MRRPDVKPSQRIAEREGKCSRRQWYQALTGEGWTTAPLECVEPATTAGLASLVAEVKAIRESLERLGQGNQLATAPLLVE